MAIAKTLDIYRAQLDSIPDEQFDAAPGNDGWSFAEVYCHIMQATLGSVLAMERCLHSKKKNTEGGVNILGWLILLTGRFPPVKTRVPEAVAERMPVQKISKEDARNLIIKCRKRLEEVAPRIRNADATVRFKHPRLGMLNAEQWLKSSRIHLQHHLKQLERIRKKFRHV